MDTYTENDLLECTKRLVRKLFEANQLPYREQTLADLAKSMTAEERVAFSMLQNTINGVDHEEAIKVAISHIHNLIILGGDPRSPASDTLAFLESL